MAGAGVRLDGSEAALAALGRLVARIEHPRGMFDEIGASLVASTQQRFQDGRAPDGSPWPPSLRALAEGGKTLIDTARLLQSQTHIASDAGVEVGTNVLYAAIHQFGGVIKQAGRQQVIHFKRNTRSGRVRFAKANKATFAQKIEIGARTVKMPARPFLGLDDDDNAEIAAITEDWLRREMP